MQDAPGSIYRNISCSNLLIQKSMLDSGAYVWFAKIIAVGELVIGIALIVGLFVGVTAFLAVFMNWNFIMSGSASVNGVFFGLAVLLVLAWRIAATSAWTTSSCPALLSYGHLQRRKSSTYSVHQRDGVFHAVS